MVNQLARGRSAGYLERMNVSAIRCALGLVLGAMTASAQPASLTPDSASLNAAGGAVTFSVAVTLTDPAVVTFDATLPDGWSYSSGSGEPTVHPSSGARGAMSWSTATPVSGPVGFSFTAVYPAGSPRSTVRFSALLTPSSGATRITPDPVAFGPSGAPLIVRQPRSVTTGSTSSTAVVRVTATGGASLSYQWRKNGIAIRGATQSFYGPTSAAPSDSGNYDVIVSNAFGSVTSDVAVLTVLDVNPGAVPPVIYTNPLDAMATIGGAASFSALAFTNYTLAYQWLHNGVPLAGATGASLVLPNVQPADTGTYSVVIKNDFGSATSRTATLTVNPAVPVGEPPVIVEPPVNQIIPASTPVHLSVTANGTPPLTYQWLNFGVPIAGANSATLDLPFGGGNYRVVVMNARGATTSSIATVALIPAGNAPLQNGSAGTVKAVAGGSAVLATNDLGSPPMSYQWYKGSVALPGQTASTLVFSNVTPSDAGLYVVMYANEFGSGRATGTLQVLPAPLAPSFNFQPSISGNLGTVDSSTTLSANVDGTGPFSFQWLKNGLELPDATSNPLVIPVVNGSDAGSYVLRVSNSAGTATSSAVTLAVHSAGFANIGIGPPHLPALTVQPRGTRVRQRAHASFAVAAVAEVTPISYQWRKDGVAIAGATEPTFVVNEAAPSDAGDYSVVVWNARGLVISEAAHLTVSGPGYAGLYFGTLTITNTPSAPEPALVVVNDDNTGIYLGPLATGRTFTVDDTGHFSASQSSNAGGIAGANQSFSFDGSFTPGGGVSGTYFHPLTATTANLAATRSPSTGPTQAYAGTYAVSVQNSSASGSVIIDANGRAFASVGTPERADFGTGPVGASGKLSIAGFEAQISGTVRTDGTVALNVTSLGSSPPLTFIGGRDGRPAPERVVNISTRAAVGTIDTNPLIAGFVIAGTAPKTVLIRAIGPTLTQFGVTNPLAAARLELFHDATAIASNSGWDNGATTTTAAISSTGDRVGAFVLPAGSKNAALLTTLEPGSYTAQVSSLDGATGVALVEVYDATENTPQAERRLINISSRAQTGAGENALVAGFVVSGTLPKRVLIRGVGPGLAQFGVPNVLNDPQLQLFDQAGATVATNDNWSSGAGPDMFSTIISTQLAAGAFTLPVQSKDAVLVLSLAPGNYTAQVTGVGSTTGTALVEVYELP